MKNKHLLLVSLSVVLAAGVISTVCAKGGLANLFADEAEVTYKHYKSIAPTSSSAGIKEYWVSCNDDSHVFAEPTGNHVTIEEGEWTEAKIESVLALNDDRKIAVGDLNAYLYQGADFASRIFYGAKNLSVDASNEKFSFHVGEDKGTREGGVYTPTDATGSGFTIRQDLLKAAVDNGYDYLNFTIKATSSIEELTANRFAYLSTDDTSSNGWQINYVEANAPLFKGATFTLDLTKYDGFTGDHANSYITFNVRSSDCKFTVEEGGVKHTSLEWNICESDVELSNIQFLHNDYSKFVTYDKNKTSVVYKVDEDGIVSHADVHVLETTEGGFGEGSGFSAAYSDFLADKLDEYESVFATLNWNLDENHSDATRFLYTKDGGKTYSEKSPIALDIENGGFVYVGCPYSGGGKQQGCTISMDLDINYCDLYIRDYSTQTQGGTSRYGFSAKKYTFTGASDGSGTVGTLVLTNGASVTVYPSYGTPVSKNTVFYADHINITNYVPAEGDVVIFTAGTYSDPENTWGICRQLTLPYDVEYIFKNGKFHYFDTSVFTDLESQFALGEAFTNLNSGVAKISYAERGILITGTWQINLDAAWKTAAKTAGYVAVQFDVEVGHALGGQCDYLQFYNGDFIETDENGKGTAIWDFSLNDITAFRGKTASTGTYGANIDGANIKINNVKLFDELPSAYVTQKAQQRLANMDKGQSNFWSYIHHNGWGIKDGAANTYTDGKVAFYAGNGSWTIENPLLVDMKKAGYTHFKFTLKMTSLNPEDNLNCLTYVTAGGAAPWTTFWKTAEHQNDTEVNYDFDLTNLLAYAESGSYLSLTTRYYADKIGVDPFTSSIGAQYIMSNISFE